MPRIIYLMFIFVILKMFHLKTNEINYKTWRVSEIWKYTWISKLNITTRDFITCYRLKECEHQFLKFLKKWKFLEPLKIFFWYNSPSKLERWSEFIFYFNNYSRQETNILSPNGFSMSNSVVYFKRKIYIIKKSSRSDLPFILMGKY